jgi:cold shock CspA family protein
VIVSRIRGVIKKYFSSRGFRFLGADGGGADLFFHVSEFLGDDADLIGGRWVEFEESRDRQGRRIAQSVILLRGERLNAVAETGKAPEAANAET